MGKVELFVISLPYDAEIDDVASFINSLGFTAVDGRILRNQNGRSKGCCLIEIETECTAEDAASVYNSNVPHNDFLKNSKASQVRQSERLDRTRDRDERFSDRRWRYNRDDYLDRHDRSDVYEHTVRRAPHPINRSSDFDYHIPLVDASDRSASDRGDNGSFALSNRAILGMSGWTKADETNAFNKNI